MADVITRFRLETTQFDSKLRDASKELSRISSEAVKSGKSFEGFSKANVDAARAPGQTASGATNAKDKVRDLVGAYNDAAKAYDKLTEEQKKSDFGKAMVQSMDQLKGRIKDAKKELYDTKDGVSALQSAMTELGGRGHRGRIAPRNWFKGASMTQLNDVADYMQTLIDKIINEEFK